MCELSYDYGKVGPKPSQNNACTNMLRHCSVTECNQVIWSYNMTSHFDIKHPDLDCDVNITPTDIVLFHTFILLIVLFHTFILSRLLT